MRACDRVLAAQCRLLGLDTAANLSTVADLPRHATRRFPAARFVNEAAFASTERASVVHMTDIDSVLDVCKYEYNTVRLRKVAICNEPLRV